jgi:hypothetical protein
LKSDKSVIIVVYPFKFCEFIVFANYTWMICMQISFVHSTFVTWRDQTLWSSG